MHYQKKSKKPKNKKSSIPRFKSTYQKNNLLTRYFAKYIEK
jgi:hypothetical protein